MLALLVGIGLTSAYFGRTWTAKLPNLNAGIHRVQSALDKAKSAEKGLDVLKKDKTPVLLEQAVPQTMLQVYNRQVAHGVTISYVTPAKATGRGTVAKLELLADTVPGTTVKSVKVNVTGTYQTYQGLLDYLESLRELPVAVVRLKVQDHNFEVSLRIFGNNK